MTIEDLKAKIYLSIKRFPKGEKSDIESFGRAIFREFKDDTLKMDFQNFDKDEEIQIHLFIPKGVQKVIEENLHKNNR